jgi:hypothetical protein
MPIMAMCAAAGVLGNRDILCEGANGSDSGVGGEETEGIVDSFGEASLVEKRLSRDGAAN